MFVMLVEWVAVMEVESVVSYYCSHLGNSLRVTMSFSELERSSCCFVS